MRYLTLLLVLAGCSTQASPPTTETPTPAPSVKPVVKAHLDSTDRIVFAGDCVTAQGQGLGGYVNLVRDKLQAKYPGIFVKGAGVHADNLDTLQRRYDYDVLGENPSVVVIWEGINDVRPDMANRGVTAGSVRTQYLSGPYMWRQLLTSLIHRTPCPVILCTPAVLGEQRQNKNDARLEEYASIVKQVAGDSDVNPGTQLIDIRKAFTGYLKGHNALNLSHGILTTDNRHLNAAGNRLAAETILKVIDP